jgi:hypothetical protein
VFARGRKTLVTTVAMAVVLLAIPSSANAGAEDLSTARAATAQFHEVGTATAAGYGEFRDAALIACIETPGVGVMGIHYVNGGLVGDGAINAATPEALVYQPLANGKLRLVAVEYIVFYSMWAGASKPSLFGQEFKLIGTPNRYGIPAFYELHAWVWQHNPSGIFKDWNPSGSCAS